MQNNTELRMTATTLLVIINLKKNIRETSLLLST